MFGPGEHVLDRLMPCPDERKRHEITIRAPAGLVLDVARNFDMQSILMIHAIFWLRAKMLGAKIPVARRRAGLVDDMLALGWECLADEPGHFFVAGAACQPWQADVVFSPIAPEQFATYAEPDRVKIAWTLEAEALGPVLTRFATETRVVTTDDQARTKFRRYWPLRNRHRDDPSAPVARSSSPGRAAVALRAPLGEGGTGNLHCKQLCQKHLSDHIPSIFGAIFVQIVRQHNLQAVCKLCCLDTQWAVK